MKLHIVELIIFTELIQNSPLCAQIVDEIFEAAVESLMNRKKNIYDKYRLLILKQSMVSLHIQNKINRTSAIVHELMRRRFHIYTEICAIK